MANLGMPLVLQNTDGPHWYVTWEGALKTSEREVVSFTVAIPRNAELSMNEVQTYALKRAVEILQGVIAQGH